MTQDRYREYFEKSKDAVLIIVDNMFEDCNASALQILRRKSKQELINKHPSEISPEYQPDGRPSYEKANEMIAMAIEKGSHRFEWDHTKADGEIVPVDVSLTSFTDANQNTLLAIWRDITQQRKAEAEKLASENKFKAIFNHRFQLTGLLAANGRLLMANQTACRFVGADSKELEGKYLWELPHWSHSEELQQKIKDAVCSAQQGNTVSFETTHIDAEGDIRFVDFSLTPVRNEKGEIIFIVPEGHDITTRKQSENRLIESERNYREIYNSSSDAIIIHDAETGKIVDVNQTMLDMYGHNYHEALQLRIGDISSGDPRFTQAAAIEKIEKAINEGPQLFEWHARHKNGNCFWVEVALRNTTIGGKGRVLAVVRDITQRKQLDSELRLVRYSMEHSAFPFEWIQQDSRFVYVNDATCRSMGYSREELCSMKVSDIDPDYSEEIWPEFWEELKARGSLILETYHQKKNGEKFPVEVTANFVEFEGQEHVFAYVQDISDRIHYENEQRQLEKKLQQAQKMEAIGTLAGGIAHDFNNILSAIFGYTELAQLNVDDSDRLRKDLNEILTGAQRAKDLVNQILTFSRKSDHELEPLNVQLILKEALKLLRSSIPSTIEIKEKIDPGCQAVLANPTQIHQIIMNLCTNAYYTMRETGGVLGVTLIPVEINPDKIPFKLYLSPGSYLLLEISDNGCGIPRDVLDRIFEPYFTTKPKGEGTGLGLAMVHGITKSFGGDVSVESEPGVGTTFHVYLPVAEQAKRELTEEVAAPLPRGNERILFVDDNDSIVQVSRDLLESLGYKVAAITKSIHALEIFQQTPNDFDLVITDVTMPGMTGIDLATHILTIRPKMPIILCTGFSELVNAEKIKEFGVCEYLMKPNTRADLARTVRKALDVYVDSR